MKIETDLDPALLAITLIASLIVGVICIWIWKSSKPQAPKKQTQPARSAAFRKVATDYEGEVYPDSKPDDEAPARRRKKDGSDGVVMPVSGNDNDRGDSADADAGTGGGGNSDGATGGGADGGAAGGE